MTCSLDRCRHADGHNSVGGWLDVDISFPPASDAKLEHK